MRKKTSKQSPSRNKPSKVNEVPVETTIYQVPIQKQASALDPFFNPNSYENKGSFRPISGYYNYTNGGTVINSTVRKRLVGLSEKIFATMGEATAASKLKSSWVVTGGFDAVFNGTNKDWAKDYAYPFLKTWYSTCTAKGLSLDFKTLLKLISRTLDRVGDASMQFTATKNGWPKLNVIDGTNIGQRSMDGAAINGGKYDGYKTTDGVILSDSGAPVAYNLFGLTDEDDQIVSATQMVLMMEPDFLSLNRGLPILFAALPDCYNLQETVFFLSQLVKRHAMYQVLETNREGRAPTGNTVSWGALQGRNNTTPPTNGRAQVIDPSPMEWAVHGKYYMKAGAGEKIEPFISNLPALETQQFLERMEKRVLQAIGIPHELMLSPGSVGGSANRGVAEQVRKTITERQELLEKYAKVAIVYAINTAMKNGIIPENFNDDWMNWSFTRGPELVLDEGNSRDADRKDYLLGMISGEDIARKNGQSFAEVSNRISQEADDLLTRAKELQGNHKEFDLAYCVQLLRQSSPNPIAPLLDNGDGSSEGIVAVKKT